MLDLDLDFNNVMEQADARILAVRRALLEQVGDTINYTCPDGIRGFIRMQCGNMDGYHTMCLDVLELCSTDGGETTLEELGEFMTENAIQEILDFLQD